MSLERLGSMTIAAQCHVCIKAFRIITSSGADDDRKTNRTLRNAVDNELERFSLWIGNIGALHPPESSLSLEMRLRDGPDLLNYASTLLEDLEEVVNERESVQIYSAALQLTLLSHSVGYRFHTVQRRHKAS